MELLIIGIPHLINFYFIKIIKLNLTRTSSDLLCKISDFRCVTNK